MGVVRVLLLHVCFYGRSVVQKRRRVLVADAVDLDLLAPECCGRPSGEVGGEVRPGARIEDGRVGESGMVERDVRRRRGRS